MDAPRRRINTYGKASKRLVVHDLFAASHKSVLHSAQSSGPSSQVVSRGTTPYSDVSDSKSASEQRKSELLTELDANTKHSRLRSPAKALKPGVNTQASTVFDIDTSDEDSGRKQTARTTVKRRKITPTSSDVDEQALRGRKGSVAAAASGSPNLRSPQRSAASKARSAEAEKRARKTAQHSRTRSLKPRPTHIPAPLSPPLQFTPEPLTPPGIRSPASDTSNASRITTRSATKRKRDANDALSDVSSPSQLEMSALRLTPQKILSRSSSGERSDPDASAPALSRVRRRLIDRLDAARTDRHEDIAMADAPLPAQLTDSTTRFHLASRAGNERTTNSATSLRRSSSLPDEDSAHDTIRPRKYGKQRSHLRDMVSDDENDSHSGSQPLLASLESQLSAMTGIGPQSSQFEFDDEDDDDEDNASQLKSIHELRHAGVVDRYDRDLDSLLDDITASIKAVRISALMQFVRKLKEQAFKRHFLDRNKVTALVKSIRAEHDIISSSIMVLAFWTLAHSESATSHILLQIYQGILRLPAHVLTEERPLSAIAKDKRENLTKLLRQDLLEFEAHVLEQSSGAAQASHIITSRIAIRALETLQRRLVAGGETLPTIDQSWIQAAMISIQRHLTVSTGKALADPGDVESMRLVMAWLELAESSSSGVGMKTSPQLLSELGSMLAELLTWASHASSDIEQLALKLIMSMSSGKKSISAEFASTAVLESIFSVLEHKYPTLLDHTRSASSDDATTSAVSTSVMLGLGCLVDFADSGDSTRLEMMGFTGALDEPSAPVLKLVNYFDLFVKEADEATDESKAPILIPFGYLCLLICTLSLSPPIRNQFSTALKPSLSEVVGRAITFLTLLSSVSVGDNSAEDFVRRFGTNLSVLKDEVSAYG
ncbi:uncharacterized protein AB675_9165 [Cyphellophora attinorum]|uniref:Wings apart-like protein C-terminal domain-containing protein n=1 Tax=Cyphellophora attinorum TaxID=1664694 RepID=A0A0N0NNK0_9EURO|nr:uncharacterized protein AB675_9165 [Phialophora attinorum]KPI41701.1 hypothetical protein AB675_9165 [Phialophora attinorum]